MHLGDKLKTLRKSKGWTQPQLAEAIGIEQSYLSKLENGKSIPSSDIFELILKTFEINIAELLIDIDESIIYRQLRQIPEVSNYLATSKLSNIKEKKLWLVSSSLAFIVGLVLMLSSQFNLLFPSEQYNYVSTGIVLKGESKEVFSNFMYGHHDTRESIKKRTEEHIKRLNQDYLLLSSYRGELFNIKVPGGSRTYQLEQTKHIPQVENRIVSFIGLFIFLVGLFGFIIEKKIHMNS